MTTSEKLLNKIYAAAVGTVVTIATQKIIVASWKFVTGDEPPNPTDPEVPATTAFIWALASGVGVGAAQLVTRRRTNRLGWVYTDRSETSSQSV